MPNVLTDLSPDLYKAADVVGRELVGFIPASTINADDSERIEVGGTVRSHFTPEANSVDVNASMQIPEGDDQEIANKTATISKSKAVQIPWRGEEVRKVNRGSGFSTIYGDQIVQAMRTLTNEIEKDLATEAYRNASRAVGTAGTTPFGSNFDSVAQVRQILVDNGMPSNDGQVSLVMNTLAGTNLRNLAQLQKANEAGGTELLRQGILLDLQGIGLRESAQVVQHVAGTGSGYQLNGAGAVKDTALDLDTGSGTILPGDVITVNGDSNRYAVNGGLNAGTIQIGETGLRQAAADNATVTVGGSYAANVAFHRRALELIIRPPALPEGGDAADDAIIIQDPHSGLVFEVRAYSGYRKRMFEVAVAWGQKAWLPKYIALLQG